MPIGLRNISAIARFLPVFEREGYAGGTWSKPERDGNVVTPSFFNLADEAAAFIQACYDHGWVLPDLDWPMFASTREAATLREDPSALAKASELQLAKLLTVIIRQDRFAEGAFASAVESGLIRRILSRAEQITAAEPQKGEKSRYGSQVREVINRNTFVSLALAEGFNAYLPVYDGGVDFILYREEYGLIRKVQLKGRWTIDKKYEGRDLWVAFPIETEWYLVPHNAMVDMAEAQGKTKTASWIEAGLYSTGAPSKAIIKACAPYRFKSIKVVANEAVGDG